MFPGITGRLSLFAIMFITLAACGGGGGGGGGGAGGGNTAPVANAGVDQLLPNGEAVILDGSGSSDADAGDTLYYTWTFVSVPGGSAITDADLSDPNVVSPSFMTDVVGDYVLQLTVDDSTASASDTVTISTTNANIPPVANAGADDNAYVGYAYTLSAADSSDANGDSLTYQWTVVSVPASSGISTGSLSDATAQMPSFTPDLAGDYELSLVVNDGLADSGNIDTVIITAETMAALDAIVPNLASDLEMYSDGRVDPAIDLGAGIMFEGWAICEPSSLTVEPVASATPPDSVYGCTHNVSSVTHSVAGDKSSVTFTINADRLYAGFDYGGDNWYTLFGTTVTTVTIPLIADGGNVYHFGSVSAADMTYSTYDANGLLGSAEAQASAAAAQVVGAALETVLKDYYYYVSIP